MLLDLLVETLEAQLAAAVADREPPPAPVLGKGRDGSGQKSVEDALGEGVGIVLQMEGPAPPSATGPRDHRSTRKDGSECH